MMRVQKIGRMAAMRRRPPDASTQMHKDWALAHGPVRPDRRQGRTKMRNFVAHSPIWGKSWRRSFS